MLNSVAVVVLLPGLLPGCTTLAPASYVPPVADDVRESARQVAVVSTVAATDDTRPHLDVPIGQGTEAAKGGAAGAGTGFLSGVMVSAAGGPLAPVLAPIVIPAFTLGGLAGGAAVGWSKAVPAEDARAAKATLSQSRADLSAEIARRIADRLPAVGRIAAPPSTAATPDLRIEVSVNRWGLAGGAGSDPLTGFFVAVSYRIARMLDGTTVAQGSFVEGGPQRTVSEWTHDNAALLTQAVDTTLSRAAEAVVDGTFLVHNFRVVRPGIARTEVCGLRPISPRSIYRFGPYASGPDRVESQSPRLVWESFPRRGDVEEDTSHVLAHVSEIRYDLRVWKNEHGGPGDLVYERTGLALTPKRGVVAHRVETPLAAHASYLWSVRARFRFDGVERVSRWSHDIVIDLDAVPLGYWDRHGFYGGAIDPYRQDAEQGRPCIEDSIPPLHYFGFTTP